MIDAAAERTGGPVLGVTRLSIARREGQVLLHDVELTLHAGEVVILAGPSGSGKSTLVNLLSGAIDVAEGGWAVSGSVIFAGNRHDLSEERITLGGVVFQDFALLDDLTIADNLKIASDHNVAIGPNLAAAIDRLLEDIDRSLPVPSASGGQRQRVAVARTLMGNHPVLFLDEPNSGLDVSSSRRLANLVHDLAREVGIPVVVIAHHFRHLIDRADRVLLLDPERNALVELPPDQTQVEATLERLEIGRRVSAKPTVRAPEPETEAAVEPESGTTIAPYRRWQVRTHWLLRFLGGYLWQLCFAPSALLFVGLGSVIVGFVATWFIFMYVPFREYLLPIVHSDALAGLAFSELRVMAPLIAAVLISVRNSALICADVGHKVYSDQIKAMRNLRVPHWAYIHAMVLLSSAVAAVVLAAASVSLTAWVAMTTWAWIFPEASTQLWRDQYFQRLWPPGAPMLIGTWWILAKAIPSILGAAAIALWFGGRPKTDVRDINRAIAQSLIWGLSFVLIWQSALTLLEFRRISAQLEATF